MPLALVIFEIQTKSKYLFSLSVQFHPDKFKAILSISVFVCIVVGHLIYFNSFSVVPTCTYCV